MHECGQIVDRFCKSSLKVRVRNSVLWFSYLFVDDSHYLLDHRVLEGPLATSETILDEGRVIILIVFEEIFIHPDFDSSFTVDSDHVSINLYVAEPPEYLLISQQTLQEYIIYLRSTGESDHRQSEPDILDENSAADTRVAAEGVLHFLQEHSPHEVWGVLSVVIDENLAVHLLCVLVVQEALSGQLECLDIDELVTQGSLVLDMPDVGIRQD